MHPAVADSDDLCKTRVVPRSLDGLDVLARDTPVGGRRVLVEPCGNRASGPSAKCMHMVAGPDGVCTCLDRSFLDVDVSNRNSNLNSMLMGDRTVTLAKVIRKKETLKKVEETCVS